MSSSSVKIHLVDYQGFYHPGQTISGYAECNFTSEKKVEAITLTFKGRAQTKWLENKLTKKNARKLVFESKETYFDSTLDLLADQSHAKSDDAYHLPSGTHSYPFTFTLPTKLPASLEQEYGNIRYYIKAVVSRPWKFDYEDKLPFNVFSLFDLNTIPQLRESVNLAAETEPCSCCFNQSGSITFAISLPVTGFTPTQTVAIGAHISNMSNANVENVVFKIVKKREFIASHGAEWVRTHQKYSTNILAECNESGVGAHSDKSWTTTLQIPGECFENTIPCTIINDRYTLMAKAILPVLDDNMEHNVDITLGTIPLAGIDTGFTAAPPAAAGDSETAKAVATDLPAPPPYCEEDAALFF